MSYDRTSGSTVTPGKINETLMMCACWNYSIILGFNFYQGDPASSPSPSPRVIYNPEESYSCHHSIIIAW
jgi:hypothetical protein